MTTNVVTTLLLLLATIGMAAPVAAQDDRGSSGEGALFLLLPVGAQAVSLGRAMTAVEGSEGAFWNPAGLAAVAAVEKLCHRRKPSGVSVSTATTTIVPPMMTHFGSSRLSEALATARPV